MSEEADTRGRRLTIAVLVAAISIVMLGSGVVNALTASPVGHDLDGDVRGYERLRCVEGQLRELLPAGTRVIVQSAPELMATDPRFSEGSAIFWSQRLTELAYPHLAVVAGRDAATFEVGIALVADEPCDGVAVTVTEL